MVLLYGSVQSASPSYTRRNRSLLFVPTSSWEQRWQDSWQLIDIMTHALHESKRPLHSNGPMKLIVSDIGFTKSHSCEQDQSASYRLQQQWTRLPTGPAQRDQAVGAIPLLHQEDSDFSFPSLDSRSFRLLRQHQVSSEFPNSPGRVDTDQYRWSLIHITAVKRAESSPDFAAIAMYGAPTPILSAASHATPHSYSRLYSLQRPVETDRL